MWQILRPQQVCKLDVLTQAMTMSAFEARWVRSSVSSIDPTLASMPIFLNWVALSGARTRTVIRNVSERGWESKRVSTLPPMYPMCGQSQLLCVHCPYTTCSTGQEDVLLDDEVTGMHPVL